METRRDATDFGINRRSDRAELRSSRLTRGWEVLARRSALIFGGSRGSRAVRRKRAGSRRCTWLQD